MELSIIELLDAGKSNILEECRLQGVRKLAVNANVSGYREG